MSTTYRTVELKDGTWGVEVTPPHSVPTTVHGFATEAEANAWVIRQRKSAPDVSERAKSIVDQVTRED